MNIFTFICCKNLLSTLKANRRCFALSTYLRLIAWQYYIAKSFNYLWLGLRTIHTGIFKLVFQCTRYASNWVCVSFNFSMSPFLKPDTEEFILYTHVCGILVVVYTKLVQSIWSKKYLGFGLLFITQIEPNRVGIFGSTIKHFFQPKKHWIQTKRTWIL